VAPSPDLSRRAFLAVGGGLALAGIAGWPALAGAAEPEASTALSALLVSNDLYVSPQPQRVAFVVYRGPTPATGPAARLALAPPGSSQGQVVTARQLSGGLPKGRGVYVVEAVFEQPGTYQGQVLTRGARVPIALEVKPAAEEPVVGSMASRAPSPTKQNPLGVDPICTRQPPCPLHAVSLSDVIGTGRPVAVLFATPALCQTRYCGPVLDELLSVRKAFEDRVTFVHVEIYRSNRGVDLAPTVTAWNIQYEPWFFTVDGAGAIRGRLDSAFGRDEITPLLKSLVTPGS
jgi:hypothetical protein